jgi:lysophospholipase L1-like esterase
MARTREAIPDTVVIRSTPRVPVQAGDLGIAVDVDRRGTPRHRLVAIGDSLTQGFQSGAVFNTDLSYPAIIAHELGWTDGFRHPQYPGYGGIPLNLELLIREIEERFGATVLPWELPSALFHLRHRLAEAEHWWDDGPGGVLPPRGAINHNLAIYGWDLRDALSRHADNAAAEHRTKAGFALVPLIRNADRIAAGRVLDSARTPGGLPMTPLEAAAALSSEGTLEDPDGDGIETLVVFLGANNALGSVLDLSVHWSQDDFADLRAKAAYNVWQPPHFDAEWAQLVAALQSIRARHVLIATVPHVTIAPIAHGIGGKVHKGSRYFEHYVRPWVTEATFDEDGDKSLTADEARAVDSAIDAFNDTIVASVADAREHGLDWRITEIGAALDRLASRRYLEDPDADRPAWLTDYPLPPALANLDPVPDSHFFASDGDGRTSGGLFSLDGVHATTVAYGLMAQEFMRTMEEAGVVFHRRDGVTARSSPVDVDFDRLLARDTLVGQPPRCLSDAGHWVGWIDERADVLRRLWAGV